MTVEKSASIGCPALKTGPPSSHPIDTDDVEAFPVPFPAKTEWEISWSEVAEPDIHNVSQQSWVQIIKNVRIPFVFMPAGRRGRLKTEEISGFNDNPIFGNIFGVRKLACAL